MDLRIFTEPQVGATYDDLLACARATEAGGFDAFFRSDHYLGFSDDPGPGSTDAWTTLAGLARETSRIRLGTLVSAATFRLPGVLAIIAAQVDQMSGGRVELGLGTAWFEQEHSAFGIPFPPFRERFERLAEQLEIITGLWSTPAGQRFSHRGRHYQLVDSPALPKPVQSPRPPVIVGGMGARRTPRIAAGFADEYNTPFASVDDARTQFGRVRAACLEAGRDPGTMRMSSAVTVICGADDAEVARRARAVGRDPGSPGGGTVLGTPAQVVDHLGRYGEAGASRIYLQCLDLRDLAHIELLAAQVLPQV